MNMKKLSVIAAIVAIASVSTATAGIIRDCNENNTTFAAKRACAGNPGTGSISSDLFKHIADRHNSTGGQGGNNGGSDNNGGEGSESNAE